jgi:predicted negative regulator of RcsB-dependent stress response
MAQPSDFPTDEPRLVDEPSSWLEENQKFIFASIALILLISIAGVWWWQGRQAKESQAASLLLKATDTVSWQQIADEYAGTPSAPLALMRLAGEAREKSDWEQALGFLDRFIREYPRHSFFPAVQLSRAQVLEAAGKQDEAFAAYEKIHQAKPSHLYSGAAVLGLARIHQSKGNPTAARNLLSDFLASERASVFATEASQALKALPGTEPTVPPAAN